MFSVNEKEVICSKGKIYKSYEPTDFEDQCGICLWVDSDSVNRVPLTAKIFEKFFTTMDKMRETKLNEILKCNSLR